MTTHFSPLEWRPEIEVRMPLAPLTANEAVRVLHAYREVRWHHGNGPVRTRPTLEEIPMFHLSPTLSQYRDLRDPQGLVQIVHQPEDLPLPTLSPETVVQVTGVVTSELRAPGGVELRRPVFRVLSHPSAPLPFYLGGPQLKAGMDLRLNEAALSLRHPQSQRIFRVQAALTAGFRRALTDRQFVEVQTPKIIATASESGANVFKLRYFDTDAYLAQSPQFYKQMMVGVFGRVFETGPVFRAEPHATGRHLSEYVSLDVEIGFIENPHELMGLLRDLLETMLEEAQGDFGEDGWPRLRDEIPIIQFADALTQIGEALGQNLDQEPDLAPSHEEWLGAWARREYESDFVFVEGYPTVKRPFYTAPDPDRLAYSRSFDLLFGGQEIVTGGMRLHRYEDYLEALTRRGLTTEGLEGYLAAFRYGMPPHGGFAIGLERLTARLLGLSNIREATLFPRDMKRLRP